MKYTAIYWEYHSFDKHRNQAMHGHSLLELILTVLPPQMLCCIFESDSLKMHYALLKDKRIVFQPHVQHDHEFESPQLKETRALLNQSGLIKTN